MKEQKYDLIIVGAGAAGLACAISALRENAKLQVLLLEAQERVGQKILVTGNGRCNLSNIDLSEDHYNSEIVRYSVILKKFGQDVEFFDSLGLKTRTDEEGRMYPYSNQASSVLNHLLWEVRRLHCEIQCGQPVVGLQQENGGWLVQTKSETYRADSVVIACGSPAGKDRVQRPFYTKLPISFRPFEPALCPLPVDPQWVKPMKGVRLQAKVTLLCDDLPVHEELGEVQFGGDYLGGICVMNCSRYYQENVPCELQLDLMPEASAEELKKELDRLATLRPEDGMETLLTGLLPKAVAEQLVKSCCEKAFSRPISSLTEEEKNLLVVALKAWTFTVEGERNLQRAQICMGGVQGLQNETLESESLPGLYFCGEAVDVDGSCGGYNLHWAWASGRAVGSTIARRFL